MAGLYIHVPFCKQRCTYCDFHFTTTFSAYRSKMIDTMCAEIQMRSTEIGSEEIETIYFGGGTPSLLLKDEFFALFNTIQRNYNVSSTAEITLEANPDDIQTGNLEIWKAAGFNRLSIGIQSFREEDLIWMNRAHTASEASNCVQLARQKGFNTLSIDLIYGLPNLDSAAWKNQIDRALSFGVDHISAYCLTVEEKTVLHKKVKDGTLLPSNEDEQAEQFEVLVSELKNKGYEQYEISNFCLSGKEAKHNTAYWKGKRYIGIGPSAHSFDGKNRRFNLPNNTTYIKNCGSGKDYFDIEILEPKERFNETLLIGLRTKWGVDLNDLEKNHPILPLFNEKLSGFKEKKWLTETDRQLVLTNEGRLFADYIAGELFL